MKRSLSLMLALLMLLSSCGSQTAETQSGGQNAPAETQSGVETAPAETVPEETIPEETELTPDLPDVTYDGEKLNVLTRIGSWAYDVSDVFSEELTGEVWNDAIFNRNLKLEETYKIELVEHQNSQPSIAFQNDVMGGLHTYELVAEMMKDMMPLALENYCLD